MIRLLSYGNQIRCGTYRLHSKFSSAANFFSDDAFAFIVEPSLGAGPLNIILEGTAVGALDSLEVGCDALYMNDEKIPLNPSVCYDSTISVGEIDRIKFKGNLRFFEAALLEYSPPKSLVFLIDERRKKEFRSTFDFLVANSFEEGMKNMLAGEYQKGSEKMRGLGYGLTPSGDDFLSGFLIALNVYQEIAHINLAHTIGSIVKVARGSNDFINAFLMCAARGHLTEKFKNLIRALACAEEDEIISCTRHVVGIGATSGADQAVGFLIGMRRFGL